MPVPKSFALSSGHSVPSVAFGTYEPNELRRQNITESVLAAIRTGYRCIDTAWKYGTEKPVGEAIRRSGVPREQMFLITKVYV